jgi:phosphoribosyl 1,2-cyclic phosphodiesterase
MLELNFYGTRGSLPVCDSRFQEFGGDTTCISLFRADKNAMIILDAGSGIRNLGKEICKNHAFPNQLDLIFSHFHWDHIQGLPFFGPAYNPNNSINICTMGFEGTPTLLEEIFKTQMQSVYFPIALDKMGCKFQFRPHQDNLIKCDDANVFGIKQNHPGDSYGYRIEVLGYSIVVCTDIEHGEAINQDIVRFANNADLLIHDAQYTNEELKTQCGWGHSSHSQAIEVAEQANVKQLILTHHDPEHDDEFLRRVERKCQDRFRNSLLARAGFALKM